MRIRWTRAATADLESIANYLFEKTPEHAARLVREIYRTPSSLKNFPNRGRAGKKIGTRELVMPSLPYIIVYQVRDDIVHVRASFTVRNGGRNEARFPRVKRGKKKRNGKKSKERPALKNPRTGHPKWISWTTCAAPGRGLIAMQTLINRTETTFMRAWRSRLRESGNRARVGGV